MTEEAKTITVDGVVHQVADLTEEQVSVVAHIQSADAEVQRLQNLIAIVSTGKQAYINQLGKELNGTTEENFTS
jgi:hypothetical protein